MRWSGSNSDAAELAEQISVTPPSEIQLCCLHFATNEGYPQNMMFTDVLAIVGLAFSAAVFLLLAFQSVQKKSTVESYLLASRSANREDFGPSMVAASTSLATVVLFFLATAQTYGVALLFCGISYLAGQAVFLHILTSNKIDTGELTTNTAFWFSLTGARRSSIFIAIMNITTFAVIFFVELYVGSVIVEYYFPAASQWGKALAFTGISALVISYVRIGGMQAVLKSDAWQMRLMLVSVTALMGFAVLAPATNEASGVTMQSLVSFDADWKQVVLFCAWISVLNFTLPFTQLSSWQRIASTNSASEAWSGLIRSIPQFLAIWVLPVLAFVVLIAKGYSFTDVTSLFDAMRHDAGGAEMMLYPMVFIGFASALFSTADTAMIAFMFASADTQFNDWTDSKKLRRRLTLATIGMTAILVIVYIVAEAKLATWFIPIVFAIFGQLALIAPQMLYALQRRLSGKGPHQFSRLGDRLNVSFMVMAWVCLLALTYLQATKRLPATGTLEVATFLSVLISGIGVSLGHWVSAPSEQGQC